MVCNVINYYGNQEKSVCKMHIKYMKTYVYMHIYISIMYNNIILSSKEIRYYEENTQVNIIM